MPSRRALLAGIGGGTSLLAGCLSSTNVIARCSSRGEGSGSRYLRRIAPITGDEEVSLGILVSGIVTQEGRFDAVTVRNPDGDLFATIPLEHDRAMSRLDPSDHDVFTSDAGELYAIPLGEPPVHGEFDVAIVDPSGDEITSASIRFNCYAADGELP